MEYLTCFGLAAVKVTINADILLSVYLTGDGSQGVSHRVYPAGYRLAGNGETIDGETTNGETTDGKSMLPDK